MKIKDMMEELKWYVEWRGSEDDDISFVYKANTGTVCAKVEECSMSNHRHILFDENCDIK